jgi:hypothetical protein
MRVPLGLVRAFAREKPRLQAKEILLSAQATTLGTGAMEKHELAAARNRLNVMANSGVQQRAPAPAASPATLSSMGIGVRVVEPDRG